MTQRRILVVDDEDNLRTMLVAALKFEGYQVAQAADGRAGLRAAKESRPDLIVLDVMMPEIDGFAMLKRLRESGDRTPVIFLTAKDTSADAVEGLGIGALLVGLGLAITAAMVEAHHGRLEIASVEGEGTRIGVVLPGVQTHS